MLVKAQTVARLQRPSQRDYESVRNFFQDVEPIVRDESRFIRLKEDLITLRSGRRNAAFDALAESWLSRLGDLERKWFRSNLVNVRYLAG